MPTGTRADREEGRVLTEPGAPARTRAHDPLAALRQRNFLLFAASRLLSGADSTLLQAAIAWQVFQLSGSALQLGLIGVARFVPALGFSLLGGAVADSYDRRKVLMLAQLGPLACSVVLFATTAAGTVNLPLIYGLVLALAVAAAFDNPTRSALLPLVVTRETFVNAVAVSSTIQQLAFVAGPTLAGLLIAAFGLEGAYAVNIAITLGAIAPLLPLRPRHESGERRAVTVAAMREGVQFVWRRQVLLGAMVLDMFAVIFAGAVALLPIYAEEILKVGPRGYGLLTSSQGLGALAISVALVVLPPVQRTGRVLLLAVAGYGLATVIFGLSRSFPLSLAAYTLTGVADQISVVMRQTTIQLATPDELRGRVSAVSHVFIGASNQLGMVESGLVAALTNATFAVVSGGLGCLAVAGLIAARMPELRRYRITPTSPMLSAPRHVASPAAHTRPSGGRTTDRGARPIGEP